VLYEAIEHEQSNAATTKKLQGERSLSDSLAEMKTAVKNKAVSYLARREHSVYELKVKLETKGYSGPIVNQALEELIEDDYLNESRYVEMMLRHHFQRGNGPNKIRHLMRQNKVANSMVQKFFQDFDGDWQQSAKQARVKRFGEAPLPKGRSEYLKEKSRQISFLLGRGFEQSDIETVFESSESCNE